MEANNVKSEKGQSLVMLAVIMIVLLGILALGIDGANVYNNRRLAQTAADAGALAGAGVWCNGGTEAEAITVANDYATNRNRADSANSYFAAYEDTQVITVDTVIPGPTFIATLFGHDVITVTATAAAGCIVPGRAVHVLPIAWSCRPPVGGSDSDDCEIHYGDLPCTWGDDPIYLIMDSDDIEEDVVCLEPGQTIPTQDPSVTPDPDNPAPQLNYMDCDIDDDGVNDMDILSGGNRAWLDLDGNGDCPAGNGGGAAELGDWIENGYPCEVREHTWYTGNPGAINAAFQDVDDFVEGEEALIPVFDYYCEGYPTDPDSTCYGPVHANDTIIEGEGNWALYFHVITFSNFFTTCVGAPGAQGGNSCPAKNWAVDQGVIPHQTKTIEGCFLEGYTPGAGGRPGDPVDAGAYTIYLLR